MDQDFVQEGEGDWNEHTHVPSRQSSNEPNELGVVGGVENGYPVEGGMADSEVPLLVGPSVEIVVDGEEEEEGVEPVARKPGDVDGSGIHSQVVPDEGAVAGKVHDCDHVLVAY